MGVAARHQRHLPDLSRGRLSQRPRRPPDSTLRSISTRSVAPPPASVKGLPVQPHPCRSAHVLSAESRQTRSALAPVCRIPASGIYAGSCSLQAGHTCNLVQRPGGREPAVEGRVEARCRLKSDHFCGGLTGRTRQLPARIRHLRAEMFDDVFSHRRKDPASAAYGDG